MEEPEETLPFSGICKTMLLDARMQALDMAREHNRRSFELGIVGQAEILRDAKDIFDWMMEGIA